MTRIAAVAAFSVVFAAPAIRAQEQSQNAPLLAKFDFENGKKTGFSFSDPAAWDVVEHAKGKALGLVKASTFKPKVRSPLAYALIEQTTVSDFELKVKLLSKAKDSAHRDLCLFFGYQDPTHFYYVHFARSADEHAHSIFLVDGKPRVSIATERTKGVAWDEDWHIAKLTYSAASGEIAAYFDDMAKPIMKAKDKTFAWGKVGIGSFDDVGLFDDVELHGNAHEKSGK